MQDIDFELIVDPWFQEELIKTGSLLVGEDNIQGIQLEELYQMVVDEEFLERSRLIVQAKNTLEIPYDVSQSQSNEELKELLGLEGDVKMVIKEAVVEKNENQLLKIWRVIPVDVQVMMFTYMLPLATVERFCISMGLEYCVKNKIFTRIFATKHPKGYSRYKKAHPNHLRPSWMLRAYEIADFVINNSNHEITFINNDKVTIYLRDRYFYFVGDTEIGYGFVSQILKKEYGRWKPQKEPRQWIPLEELFEKSISIFRNVIESIVYSLLKNGFTVRRFESENVPTPDVMSCYRVSCTKKATLKCGNCLKALFCSSSCAKEHIKNCF